VSEKLWLNRNIPVVAHPVIPTLKYDSHVAGVVCTIDVGIDGGRHDARAAIEAAPVVADVLAKELGRDAAWRERDLQNFITVAQGYVYLGE